MFNSIAKGYDRANAALSFSFHKKWNQILWNEIHSKTPSSPLLDLCCGTGESSLPYLLQQQHPMKAVLLDFSEGMLACAKQKGSDARLHHHQIQYMQADAQSIPLPEASMQSVIMAYAIRNVQDPFCSLSEIFRVLMPGGTIGILELTRPKNPFLRWGHSLYLRTFLPLMGRWITSNQEAYAYLNQSIHSFIEPKHLAQHLSEIGFLEIQIKPLSGGIATLFLGKKR